MNTALPTRPKMDERFAVVLPADEKHRLYEVAARRRTTASELVRRAIAEVTAADQPSMPEAATI